MDLWEAKVDHDWVVSQVAVGFAVLKIYSFV
jgi:hypothetical protein